jgi:DNA-binding protein
MGAGRTALSQVGRSIQSYIYRISDSLWNIEVRKNLRKLVTYIENNDSSSIWKDLESPLVQERIIGHCLAGQAFYKFRQAALAIACIKNEHPKHISQIASAGEKIFSMKNIRFSVFQQDDSKWRIPTSGSSKKEVMIVKSFVLLLPSLARTASFQTPEHLAQFRQFQHGQATNLQLYAAFSKLKGQSHRETRPYDTVAGFEEIRFLFRTIRDASTVYYGKRFENFSFLTTSEAGVNTFQMAFYFLLVGRARSLKAYPVSSEKPAGTSRLVIEDKTGEQYFDVYSGTLNQNKGHMENTIQEFFQLTEHVTKLGKDHFIVALVRWPLGLTPQIVYTKYLGSEEPKRLDEFYLLAYMNTRKKVPVQGLKEMFPSFSGDHKHLVVHGDNAYFEQEWQPMDEGVFADILLIYGLDTWIRKFKDTDFPLAKYFNANEDARRLYLSTNPIKDFCETYNAEESRWFLLEEQGNLVRVGDKPIMAYVTYAMSVLAEKGSARIIARGAKIKDAEAVCGIIAIKPGYSITGSVKKKIKLDSKHGGWGYVDEIQITLVNTKRS